jgi:predicted permease
MNLRFWRNRRRDSDLEEEISTHLNLAAAERIERGESAAHAAARARREFGNIGLIREITREFWGWASLERIGQDIRFGTRVLLKSPGFTIIAILTLALGIGANTALFSVVNGVLLNPLPYPEPDRLVTLHESKPNFETGSVSYPNFLDWQRENHSFSAMAIARPFGFTYTGNGGSEQITAEFVSSDFFSLLGVKPQIGRVFMEGEDKIGAAPIALISAGFWKRKFAASPEVLGKSVELNGMNYTVTGVVPESFNFNAMNFSPSEVYLPVGQWDNPLLTSRVAGLAFHGLGRLKPGVSLQQARDDMNALCRGLEETYPEADKGIRANLKPLRESVLGSVQPILLVLLGAVAFVLLIACVNVANLLIARSTGRAREFAIRIALGAGRARLLRQLVTESLLLSVTGGALGLLLAFSGTKAALASLPSALPRADEVGIDIRVLLFTLGISILAGLIFGLAPALKILKPRIQTTLSEGGRSFSSSRQRVHGIFVVVEVALALVLLVGAGLLARSMAALWRVDPGFYSDHVLTFGLNLSPSLINAKPGAIRATLRELEARLESTQGVRSSSLSWGAFPMSGDDELVFWLDGQPKPSSPNDMHWALKYVVEPHYLDVMRIPLLRGRFFSATDDELAAPVVVVDDVFARKYFGDQDPIGKRLRFDTGMDNVTNTAEIIGVVGHVKQWGVDVDDKQQLRVQTYVPFMQMPDEPMSLVPAGTTVALRFEGSSSGVFDRIREALRQLNSEQVVYSALTMDEIIAGSLASQRFSMILLGGFAALALILSTIGIYGVISYLVAQRTNEIGIRMALGAQRSDVLKLIVGHGARMALIGIAIGVVAALALTRLMSTMLFGVTSHDPLTFVSVAALLISVALFACYLPARRATRVDPVVALRYE